MAVVERFKQESMYGLDLAKKIGCFGEVAVSGVLCADEIRFFFLRALY